jgi:hypothetical protein
LPHVFFVGIVVFCVTVVEAFTVSGTFNDYLTDSPIDSCRTILYAYSPGMTTDSVRSGADGIFAFDDVAAGVYKLVVADERYAHDTVWLTIEKDTAVTFVLNDRKHLLDTIPDTLFREHSPYIVCKTLSAQRSVTVQPGVTVFFRNGSLSFYGHLTAEGTVDDSIVFAAKLPETDTVDYPAGLMRTFHSGTTVSFKYCRFERLRDLNFKDFAHLAVTHCLFTGMWRAIAFYDGSFGHEAVVSNNRIINCVHGVTDRYTNDIGSFASMAYSLVLTDNLLWCDSTALRLSVYTKAFVDHNTFIGQGMLDMDRLKESDTVTNNIFSGITFDNAADDMLYFAYNSVDNFPREGEGLTGVGTLARTNGNDDSCDYFFNIWQYPRIADSASGMLYKNSPCIGAASDGTNIGVYQGEGAGVRERDIRNRMNAETERFMYLKLGGNRVRLPWKDLAGYATGTVELSLFTLRGERVFVVSGGIDKSGNALSVHRAAALPPVTPGCYLLQLSLPHIRYSRPVVLRYGR